MKTATKVAAILSIGILLKFVGKIAPSLNTLSTVVGVPLYLYFLFTKVPIMLNKHFDTAIFKSDRILRLGLMLTPSFLFVTLSMTAPMLFLPQLFSDAIPGRFDAGQFILVSFVGIMVSSLFFGWRLWKKYDVTIEKILKRTVSAVDVAIDLDGVSKGGKGRLMVTWQIGEEVALLSVGLFVFWLITWVVDWAYLFFVSSWLVYEILNHEHVGRYRMLRRTLVRINKMKEQNLFWETFSKGFAFGSIGFSVAFLAIVSTAFSCVFLVISFAYPLLFLSWLLFCGWYILLLSFQIAKRLNSQLQWIRSRKESSFVSREIPKEDLAICAISFLYVLMTFVSHASDLPQYESFFFNLHPANLGLTLLMRQVGRTFLILSALCLTNIFSIYSAIEFARKPLVRNVVADRHRYLTDKGKLSWLCILATLLVGSAYSDVVVPLLALVAAIIVYSFSEDIELVAPRIAPWKYAAVNALIASFVTTASFTTLYMFSQYDEKVRLLIQPALLPTSLILMVISVLYVIACYRTQRRRLQEPDGPTWSLRHDVERLVL